MTQLHPTCIALLCLLLSSTLYSQSFKTLYQIPESQDYFEHSELLLNQGKSNSLVGLRKSTILDIEIDNLKSLFESKNSLISVSLPSESGDEITLHLREVKITQPNAILYAQSIDGLTPIEDSSRHFRGIIEGRPESKVAFSLTKDNIQAMIVDKKGQKTLAKLRNSDSYIYYDTQDLLSASGFDCSADNLQSLDSPPIEKGKNNTSNCVGMYLEIDHNIFLDYGSVGATTTYIMGLFNQVSALYAAESITLNIQELKIWAQEDPYVGPNTLDYLNQFQDELNGNFNGDLAHLIGYGTGGVAYVNTLCYDLYGIGYSGISGNYQEIPVYSWSVEVITHEIGHNLGSPHTHSCAWNGNNTAIDGCGPSIGASEGCNGPLPVKGTIMSYCHLVSGIGIDFNLGFGEQPGDLIRANVNGSPCLSACDPDEGCTSEGLSCDDNDACTIDDKFDENCICLGSYIDNDGDGFCISNDPDDTDSCIPDNSGTNCALGCVDYNYTTLEFGFEIWNDGGSDCMKSSSSQFTYEGNYSILIRDNSNAASSTYTDDLQFSGLTSIQLDFVYYPYSMEAGEDFFLEISLDGGDQYQVVKSWVSDQDFKNGEFYSESVLMTDYQFTDNTRLRLRCDASTNTDRIYLDNLLISICNEVQDDCTLEGLSCEDGDPCTTGEIYDIDCNCTNGVSIDNDNDGICAEEDPDDNDPCLPNNNHLLCEQCQTEGLGCDDGDPCTLGEVYDEECDCIGGQYTDDDGDGICVGNDPDDNDSCNPNVINCDQDSCNYYNFESYELSMGIWNDGGVDCQRISNTTYANTGIFSIRIRDNSGNASSMSTTNIDAANIQEIKVTFSFKSNSMESNEDFFLEISSNGGSTYTIVEDWISGIDFNNNIMYSAEVTINSLAQFSSSTRLRFRCDASTNSDQVYIDDVNIELCGTISSDDLIGTPILNNSVAEADIDLTVASHNPVLNIYPNPVSQQDKLQISVDGTADIKQIRLYDIYGRLHLTKDIEEQSNLYNLEIGESQSGTYLVVVITDGNQWPQKIVIK